MTLKTELKLIHKVAIVGVFVIAVGILVSLALPTHAVNFSVNSTADTSDYAPGDGFCDANTGTEMVCTLRAAIEEANAQGGNNYIDFSGLDSSEAEDSQWSIELLSELPTINHRLTITAENQWNADNDRPGVWLKPTSGTSILSGLYFNEAADNSRVSGLKISGFTNFGIQLGADNCQIGLDCLGTPDTHQRNVIINNGDGEFGDAGLLISSAENNHVAGNWFGLDEDGVSAAKNNTGSFYIVNSDNNIVGFEDDDNKSYSCTPEQARNIFADHSSILTDSEHNRIAGNYFNVLPDGSDIVEYSDEYGVYLWRADNNFIGTDGDGRNDADEGNVFAGYGYGVYLWHASDTFGGNRIAGNIFGGDPTRTQDLYTGSGDEIGIALAKGAQHNIVGYCDDDDDDKIGDATMCSSSGTAADQANYFIGMNNTDDSFGMFINSPNGEASNYVYGNYFGVGTDDSALPLTAGIRVLKAPGGYYNHIGDEGARANTIKNNTYGILSDNRSSKKFAVQNWKLEHNTITDNTLHGVYLEDLMHNQDDGSTLGILIDSNTISDNGDSGIALAGSSAEIYGNTVANNTLYGISVESKYNDNVDTYGQQSYLDAANDFVGEPVIGAAGQENTILGNQAGGIKLLDTFVANEDTLFEENVFENNNDQPAIASVWWGAVELLDSSLNSISAGEHTVSIISQSGTTYAGSAVDLGEFAGENDTHVAWGPTGLDLDDQTSWFQITNYDYDTTGTRTDHGPFSISIDGEDANDSTLVGFTFDGLDNDVDQGGLSASQLTGSETYRYQIAEAIVSTVPDQPSNLYPEHAKMAFSTAPTLTASDFIDTNETHTASHWRVYDSELACAQGGTGNIYDSSETADLISHQIPGSAGLIKVVNYWWTVTYKNSFGNYSDPSTCTYFWIKSGSNLSLLTTPSMSEVEEPGTEELKNLRTEEPEVAEDDDQVEEAVEEATEVVLEESPETPEIQPYDLDGLGGGTTAEIPETLETPDLTFDLYIKNPDGSVRYSNTDFVETSIVAQTSGHQLYRFEDKGTDFDYNDVLIEVRRTSDTALQIHLVAVQASWHHQIYAEVGGQDILLWNDSHEAVGQTAILAVVNNDLLGMEYRQGSSSIHAQAYLKE